VRRPADIGPAEASAFVSVPADEFSRPFDFKDDLSHFRWALATARHLPPHRPASLEDAEAGCAVHVRRGDRLDGASLRATSSARRA
jgi:hypothetical protein